MGHDRMRRGHLDLSPDEKRLHSLAVEWLSDRANPEKDGGLGMFADTRFCIDLMKLLQQVEQDAVKRALTVYHGRATSRKGKKK